MVLFAIIALASVALLQNLTLRALEARVASLESKPYRAIAGGKDE